MLIEQNTEFKLKGSDPPGRIRMYSYNWLIS